MLLRSAVPARGHLLLVVARRRLAGYVPHVEAQAVERDTPFPVALAAIVALCKGAFLVVMGIIGFAAANSVSDSWGVGVFIFGIIFGLAGLLIFRGNRIARDVLGVLSLVSVIGGVIYAFSGPTSAIVPSLITAGVAAGVIALLYLPESSKAFFR